ncbi:hypothetical protein FJY63_05135 [Candidatus Sumerlaeota bacterium]|nr:hypothetical protein [Candidatus Sumerlaeota bacterium]
MGTRQNRIEKALSGRARLAKVALLGAVVVLLAPFTVPTVERIVGGLRYPYQMDSEEGLVLWYAWQLRHGHNVFRQLDSPPYVAATYGPVYPLACAATLWGKESDFFGGRLIAALSVGAICVLMALIVWRQTRQVLPVVLGLLLFLNSYDVYQWLPFYRVDFPALALGLAGLWLIAGQKAEGKRLKGLRAASLCFVAMVYTRQVEVAPLLAALIYLFLHKRDMGWRLLRNVGAAALAIAVVLTALTRGQFLLHNVYYNMNPFDTWQLKRLVNHAYTFNRFFIVASLVAMIWFVMERFRHHVESERSETGTDNGGNNIAAREDQWGALDLFALYAAISTLDVLGLGKIGAATNYLIEPKAAWSLFIALVLGKTIRPSMTTGRVIGRQPVFMPVAFVLLLHGIEFLCSSTAIRVLPASLLGEQDRVSPAGTQGISFVRDYLRSRPQILYAPACRNPGPADLVSNDRIVEMVREADEPVFCEHTIWPLMAGKAVYIQPFIMQELAKEGKWDQTPVVEALRQKRFSLVITTEDIRKDVFFWHYSREMIAAMREAYALGDLFGGTTPGTLFTYYVFVPR